MYKNYHKLLLIGICLFSAFGLYAQEESIFSGPNVIPPSPNATAFNKFIDIPVGHYTGVPNISVPIYTLSLPQLTLPISLNYHASGLKVGEQSSWIGAGWSLNAGGAINRTVRGLPDEYLGTDSESDASGGSKYGFLRLQESFFDTGKEGVDVGTIDDCSVTYPITPPKGPINDQDFFAQGYWDTEPDLYHYSFPGGSGKFVFNRNRDLVKFEVDDNSFITPLTNPSILPNDAATIWVLKDTEFTITDAAGVLYTFNKTEASVTGNYCGDTFVPDANPNTMESVSSWMLTRMERGGNWIDFTYVDETINYEIAYNETRSFTLSGETSPISNFCRSFSKTKGKRLNTINTSNGYEVIFEASTADRLDRAITGSKNLKAITVEKDGVQIMKYKLDQDYFGTNEKLKLNSVNQVSNNTAETELPGYDFTYYAENSVPATTSLDQDYWGYFNYENTPGSTNNTSMVPHWKTDLYHFNQYSNVNREPNFNATRTGTMSKVTYPTGGYSEFDFELNESYDPAYNKTYQYELTTPGAANQTNSVNFVVNQATSITLIGTNVGTDEPGGIDKAVTLNKCAGPGYTNCSKAALTSTIGNRFTIPAGNYQLFGKTLVGADMTNSETLKVIFEQVENTARRQLGGLRVRKVTFFDPVKSESIEKVYDYSDGNNSSGKLFTPIWSGGSISTYIPGRLTMSGFDDIVPQVPLSCIDLLVNTTKKVTIGASPSIPISTYQGSHVGYGKVREISLIPGTPLLTPSGSSSNIPVSKAKNGLVEYEFVNELPLLNLGDPYVPVQDLSHKNGKPLKQATYKYVNDLTLTKLQETIYEYDETVDLSALPIAKGVKIAKDLTKYCYSCTDFMTSHIWNYYTLSSAWFPLERQTTKQYNEDGSNPLTTIQDFTYDMSQGHYMYVSTSTTDSEGDVYRSEFERDITNPALITQRETFKDGGTPLKVSGERVLYFGGLPQNYQVWNRELDGTTSGGILFDGYEAVKKYSYNIHSLLKESLDRPSTEKKSRTAYLWGYNKAYVIAQISNMTQAELYTKLSSVSTSRTILEESTSTSFMKTKLEALRGVLTQKDQLMTLYLYDTRYGLSETQDPNGRTTKYEYDAFGRMLRVKDHSGNVLQENEYNYSNQ